MWTKLSINDSFRKHKNNAAKAYSCVSSSTVQFFSTRLMSLYSVVYDNSVIRRHSWVLVRPTFTSGIVLVKQVLKCSIAAISDNSPISLSFSGLDFKMKPITFAAFDKFPLLCEFKSKLRKWRNGLYFFDFLPKYQSSNNVLMLVCLGNTKFSSTGWNLPFQYQVE